MLTEGVRWPCEACAAGRRTGPKQAASNVTFFQIGVTYVTLPIFKGFRAFSGGWHSKSKVTENRFTTKSKQRKKSSGSTLGFSVLGGAAFCVVALAEICPEYRLFFPGADPAVLVVNQVKNFLLSIHRQ